MSDGYHLDDELLRRSPQPCSGASSPELPTLLAPSNTPNERSFRLRGKRFFFTWSQVEWTTDHAQVKTLLDSIATVEYTIIAREQHKDGGTHFHAAVQFTKSQDRKVSGHADLDGQHPNIKNKANARAWEAAKDYCKKDGQFKEYGEQDTNSGELLGSKIDELYDQAEDFYAFLKLCLDNSVPFGYCQASWNAKQTRSPTIDVGETSAGIIESPILRALRWADTSRAIVIVGPTGCGKTTWAVEHAPRPALFVSDIDDLKSFRVGFHNSIIFDDMCFSGDHTGKGQWPVQKQIHLVDFHMQRSIRCRYTTARIPAGVHKVFTCNEYPFSWSDAIARRVLRIDV
jgi:hypothetical protein